MVDKKNPTYRQKMKQIDQREPQWWTSFGSANVTRRHATFVKVPTEQMVNLVLFVLLRYTNSDYPFGIFKLFL